MLRLSVAAAALLFAVGCVTTNPVHKARTDELVMQAGRHQEGPPSSYQPQTWKPGSWIAFKSTSDGKPSWTKISILSHGPDGYWVQTESQSYDAKSISKALYKDMPKDAKEAGDLLRRIVTKSNDEEPQTVDLEDPTNPMAGMFRGMMNTANISAPKDVSSSPKETATVAAGTFEACAKYDATWTVGPISQTVTSWWHPAVPVNGAVKGVSTDGKYTLELLDYGWTGATDALAK